MQRQLTSAALDVGRLQGQLEAQRQMTLDLEETRRRLADAEARAEWVEAENEQLRAQLALTSKHVQMDGTDVEDIPTMSSEPTPEGSTGPVKRPWWRRLRGGHHDDLSYTLSTRTHTWTCTLALGRA